MSTAITAPSAPVYGLPYVPDIDFAVKDPTVIESEVITDYEAAFLQLTNVAKQLAPGDPIRLFLLSVCYWLSHQRVIIDFTGKMNLLKYAHDNYLDNLAALYGERALRLQPAAAVCTLQFTLTAALAFDALIPAGTQVMVSNNINFATDAPLVIAGGQLTGTVTATCTQTGIVGNGFLPGQVNALINWNQPWAVDVQNLDTTANGTDRENDDQYRYRIWLAIESFAVAGPQKAYEFWALSAHPDIIQAVIYSAPDIAGEVWIYPLLTGGQIPNQIILDLVYQSCTGGPPGTKRPLTDWVSVFQPTPFIYTLNFDYYVGDENEVLLGSIQTAVNQAAFDWILWQRSYVSRDINCDELRKRCLEAGAKRLVIHSPSPDYQELAYNALACHDPNTDPRINFAGLEDA